MRSLQLTEREQQVLKLLAEGKTDQVIAQTLYLSVRTIHDHVEHIRLKFCATNRVHAVVKALQEGVLDLPSPTDSNYT